MSYPTIYKWALAQPTKTAITHNGNAISYAAFARSISNTIDSLNAQKLPTDQTVIVLVHHLLDCWVTVLALQAVGINTVCVRSTALIDELSLNNVQSIVTTEGEAATHNLQADPVPGYRVITIQNPAYDSEEIPTELPATNYTGMGGHILYTSGTTGNYKKLFWTGEQLHKCTAERVEFLGYKKNEVSFDASFGLWTAVGYKDPLATWYAGGSIILDQRPDWYKHFPYSKMTWAILVPDMISQLLDSLEKTPDALPSSNFTLDVTSGFVSRKSAEQIMGRITTKLRNVYGSTEINLGACRADITDLDDLHWLIPANFCTIEIIDEDGNPCPVNAEGEIRILRSELDCASYLDDPQATEKVFRDGYFYPGDMAVRRDDGRIRILGRCADVINFGGSKHSVAPIELEIQNRLGVEAACLFSGVSSAGEDEVVIVIESDHWPEKSDLNNLGHEFAQFDQVRFAIVYPFPRTQTGTSKVNRVALRKLIFQGLPA